MVYTFLISVVFIAELIIAVTILRCLFRLSKSILVLDKKVTLLSPTLSEIFVLMRKISKQSLFFAQDFVDRTRQNGESFITKFLSKFIIGLLFFNLNFKFIKRIRKSKITKTLAKGLSILESMV